MRLIDADALIERIEDDIKAIEDMEPVMAMGAIGVRNMIKKALTELEIVHCKDCIHHKDCISRQAAIEALTGRQTDPTDEEIMRTLKELPPVEPKPVMTEEVREALMRLTMCAREECSICKYENDCGYDKQVEMATENMNTILNVFLERPKGEWVPCTEPPEDRRNVFLAHGTNDFKSCCIGHYEQGMGWYEDRNFFAKPIYDCKYWCDIPELPDMGDNQFDMRGDKE